MHRTLASLLFASVLLLALTPARSALAQGPVLRGREIDVNTTIAGTTGKCHCEWTWYTVGLRPGVVQISATVKTFISQASAPTYGISLVLMQQAGTRAVGRVSCPHSAWQCNKTLTIKYRVTHPGVYYLVAEGFDATGISYAMRIQGNIYPLHCHKYC